MGHLFRAVEVEILTSCNMQCSYCPNSIDDRVENGHMSWKIYSLLIEQLNDIGFSGRMSFDFYNEPLLSNKLESFIDHAKNNLKNIQVYLYTNGTKLTLPRFKKLVIAGVDKFIVTKHEGIKKFIFEDTWKGLGNSEKDKVEYRNFDKLNLTNRGGILSHIGNEHQLASAPCMIPSYIITVTSKGNVLPCFEDFYQINQMGNIMEEPIEKIWHSHKYTNFRKKLLLGMRAENKVCKNCNRAEVLF